MVKKKKFQPGKGFKSASVMPCGVWEFGFMLGVRGWRQAVRSKLLFSMSHDPKYQTKTMKLRNIAGVFTAPHTRHVVEERCWGQEAQRRNILGASSCRGGGAGDSLEETEVGKGKDEAVALYLCSLSLPGHFRVSKLTKSIPRGLKFLFSFSQRLKWWKEKRPNSCKTYLKAQ